MRMDLIQTHPLKQWGDRMRLNIFNNQVDIETGFISDVFEDALRSAIIVSLMTDRRANIDDVIPDAPITNQSIPPDRRGWAGDALADVNGDRVGSRLWLLYRKKQTEETRRLAIEYCQEALQWLLVDKIATSVLIKAEWAEEGRLNVGVTIILLNGDSFNTTLTIGVVYAV